MTAGIQPVVDTLSRFVSAMTARNIVTSAARRLGLAPESVGAQALPRLVESMDPGLRLFLKDAAQQEECRKALRALTPSGGTPLPSVPSRQDIPLVTELDIVRARNAARDLAAALGFNPLMQTRLATVVSELARNAVQYAGGGTCTLLPLDSPRVGVEVRVEDTGKGIPNLDDIMVGQYRSRSGMGQGLRGCRKAMDALDVTTGPHGTHVMGRLYRA